MPDNASGPKIPIGGIAATPETPTPLHWLPLTILLALPYIYIGVLVVPPPLGCGLFVANDFPGHRIWYAQVEAYFLSRGYVPLWNPAFEMGTPHFGNAFGTSFLYPPRWWVVAVTSFGGAINYFAQYLQIALHMSLALGSLYAILRRFAGASREASALGAAVFLLNQPFNNFLRFPHGIENMSLVPPMLYFALSLTQRDSPRRTPDRRAYAIDFLALALCVALGWLTGYGQYTYAGGLFVGIVVLCFAKSLAGPVATLLAAILGTIAAAGMLWPTFEWVSHHPLRDGRNIMNINVQGVIDYADMLLRPFGVDVHFSMFTLPHVALLALVGAAAVRSWKNRRLSIAMALTLIAILDVSRGLSGFSFEYLYRFLPGFSAFNSPSKMAWMAFIPLAWFTAIGIDVLDCSRQRRIIACVVMLAAGAALAAAYSPTIPTGPDIWKPQAAGWISAAQTQVCYAWLTLGIAAMLAVFLLLKSRFARGLIVMGLCLTFTLAFARYSTFLDTKPDPQALIASNDGFPDGLLARRSPLGYLGLTGVGVVSDTVDPVINALMRQPDGPYLGPAGAKFPASRFLWMPDAGSAPLRLSLLAYGPNHMTFDLVAEDSGRLIYLAKYSPHWTCNQSYRRSALCDELCEFRVEPGATHVEMSFAPADHIVLAIWTVLSVVSIGATILVLLNRKRLAIVVSLAGLLVCLAFLAGALNRQPMNPRDLFGADARSLDPTGLIAPYTPR